MHEMVIRRGTVIDGSGAEARIADVAIDDGRITAIEPDAGLARRDILMGSPRKRASGPSIRLSKSLISLCRFAAN